MASITELLQAGVDADQFLVGPAVILLQSASNYSNTGEAADAMPEGIEDIINVTTAVAMTANGWEYLGYTENVNPSRNRTVVQHDSDQEARVKTVHDAWENTLTVTALETTLAKISDFWGGSSTSAAAGASPDQTKITIGNPSTISNRRVAIVFIDDSGYCWAWVWRKCDLRPTGGPTFTRTGRVEWPLEITCKSDTRVSDVDDRVLRVYKTDASIA